MNAIRRTGPLQTRFSARLGYDGFARLVVREKDRPLGGLVFVARTRRERVQAGGQAAPRRLEAFLAHALAARGELDAPLGRQRKLGFIVANAAGKPIYSSRRGGGSSSSRPIPGSSRAPTCAGSRLCLPALVRLCRDLAKIFAGDPVRSSASAAPSQRLGRLHLPRALARGRRSRIGPRRHCRRLRRALPIKLMRSLARQPLSRRQAEVCLPMATGSSYESIARQLGISRHTAISHSRWIYDKLDVHNRAELINRLLSS